MWGCLLHSLTSWKLIDEIKAPPPKKNEGTDKELVCVDWGCIMWRTYTCGKRHKVGGLGGSRGNVRNMHTVGDRNLPSQNTLLSYKDYFELEASENQQMQKDAFIWQNFQKMGMAINPHSWGSFMAMEKKESWLWNGPAQTTWTSLPALGKLKPFSCVFFFFFFLSF